MNYRKDSIDAAGTDSPLKSSFAFTLIELLICIAVIMILIAMLMPVLGRVKQRAKLVVCMNSLKQIGAATIQYASDDSKRRIQAVGCWAMGDSAGCNHHGGGLVMHYVQFQGAPAGHYGGTVHADKPTDLGMLIGGGYMGSWTDDEASRCPDAFGAFTNSRGDSTHLNYWKSASVGSWVNTRASYMRNSFCDLEDDWNGIKLQKLSPDDPLYADSFPTYGVVIRFHGARSNVLYADGGAKSLDDSPLTLDPGWNGFTGGATANNSTITNVWEYYKTKR